MFSQLTKENGGFPKRRGHKQQLPTHSRETLEKKNRKCYNRRSLKTTETGGLCMRYHTLRFDIWCCLALGVLVGFLVGKLVDKIVPSTYESYVEEHTVADGEIGGKAGDEVFRAQDIEDLLSHDTFTVVSEGITYRNRGLGYYGNEAMHALTLPSGELVAAKINMDAVTVDGDYYTGESTMPVGRVVWEDLSANETFINQIEYAEPLSRRDFYIDMLGTGGRVSETDFHETWKTLAQVLSVIICFPIFHALGSSIGIFPYFFPPKKKKKAEWD